MSIQRATAVVSPSAPVLSIDEYRLLVFIIRCAGLIALFQMFLPKDERIPLRLLWRLIWKSKKIVPRGTSSARKMPRSAKEMGWQFFLAINAIRLSQNEIWRAGHIDLAEIIDKVYSLLLNLGVRAMEKKRLQKAAAASD